MSIYVVKGRYDAANPSIIIPDAAAGTPLPIGRARSDGLDVRIAPRHIVIQSWLDIPASLATDIGAVEVYRETIADGELSDGWAPPEAAVDDGAGKYRCAAINKRMPEDGKADATGAQVTNGSASIIAAMVAEAQARAIADYKARVISALLAANLKLTAAQKTALQSGALAALQAAKLCP